MDMRHMKKTIATTAVLAALIGMGTGASAQPGSGMGPGGPGMWQGKGMMDCDKRHGHRVGPGAKLDRMTVYLGLTPEQRHKILPILDDQFREMQAVRADDNLTRAQARTKMAAIRDKSFERMKGILTTEQQKKADELKAKMAERCKFRQEKMSQPAAGPQK
ncbi:hypothetical protein FDZ71_12135 [bacterium]|nr:MAG: hypothetical protein FDZ71_12135 [bacterium]